MVNSTTIAWGIPVEVNTVGAHVEAYVEHRIIVNAFLGCVTDGLQQYLPVGKLVPELAYEIVRHLGPPLFEEYARTWDDLLACCDDSCFPTMDFSDGEREAVSRQFFLKEPMDEVLFDLEYQMCGEHSKKHDEVQRDMLRRIGKSTVSNDLEEHTFATYNKILEQDFGLQVYFAVCDRRHGHEGNSVVNILAHLIRPSYHQTLFPCSGMRICSSSTAMIVDPAVLQLPYIALKSQFNKALSCLDLSPNISYQHTQPSQSTMSSLSEERHSTYPQRYDSTRDSAEIRFQRLQEGLEDSDWPKLMILSQLRLKTPKSVRQDPTDSEDGAWD
ncbi:hypothetical protein MMC17_005019 [Xylographa soralifera]|nr:hypothetical protein [Xylographa soralifera]